MPLLFQTNARQFLTATKTPTIIAAHQTTFDEPRNVSRCVDHAWIASSFKTKVQTFYAVLSQNLELPFVLQLKCEQVQNAFNKLLSLSTLSYRLKP